MEQQHSITNFTEHKRRQHLRSEERCNLSTEKARVQQLRHSLHHQLIVPRLLVMSFNVVRRHTLDMVENLATLPNRELPSIKPTAVAAIAPKASPELWIYPLDVNMIRKHSWSFDVCAGRARQTGLFSACEIPSTKTLYRLLWNGELPLTLFELPEVLNRRSRKKPRLSKRIKGQSIDERIPEVVDRNAFGHWESDTVLGRKKRGL